MSPARDLAPDLAPDPTPRPPGDPAGRVALAITSHGQLVSLLGRALIACDRMLSAQLSEVIDHPRFAALEGRWRGLHALARLCPPHRTARLRLLDAGWTDLSRDLDQAGSVRRTLLWRLVGDGELNTLGGEPLGLLVVDHGVTLDLDTAYDDLLTLELLATLGERLLCPVVMTVADDFFGEAGADWLSDTRRVASLLQSDEFAGWRALRAKPAARFLGLVLPSLLARRPYRARRGRFRFDQSLARSHGLWISGAFAFAAAILREHHRTAWFGYLKLITDTPGTGATLAPMDTAAPAGTEPGSRLAVRLTRGMGEIFSRLGFVPLCESLKSGDLYAFGNASVRASGPGEAVLDQLQSTLMSCRMAHFLKARARRLIGQSMTADECEYELNRWLEAYTGLVSEADPEILARYPLREARVEITARDADEQELACRIYLKPQYQVDHMAGEIVLATDVGPDRAA